MDCPACASRGEHSRLIVRDTRTAADHPRVVRRRVCEHDAGHVLETVENPIALSLEHVVVRRSGDRRAMDLFSRTRLFDDIKTGVLKRLSDEEVAALANDVHRYLTEHLDELVEPIDSAEAGRFDGVRGSIDDNAIREAVEFRLRGGSDRVAHVLFTLSFRGRVDVPTRTGFRDA
jgi:transcriptional regulator NrdR family protein